MIFSVVYIREKLAAHLCDSNIKLSSKNIYFLILLNVSIVLSGIIIMVFSEKSFHTDYVGQLTRELCYGLVRLTMAYICVDMSVRREAKVQIIFNHQGTLIIAKIQPTQHVDSLKTSVVRTTFNRPRQTT